MAGLYGRWRDPTKPDGDPGASLWTCTIVTTHAEKALSHLHDRMPVRLDPEHWDAWLDPCTPKATVEGLLAATPRIRLHAYPVGSAVNNVRNDGPELVLPVATAWSEDR